MRRGQRMRPPQPQRPAPNLHKQESRLFQRQYEQQAGWCQPMPEGYWHYFRANDALSLCGRWLFSGAARDDSNHDRDGACADCSTRRRQIAEGRC